MTRSERKAAFDSVGDYHAARLGELLIHVGEVVEQFRAGDIDAFEADRLLFKYSQAAKELWKFCNGTDVEFTAHLISDGAPVDWWERGAPRRR